MVAIVSGSSLGLSLTSLATGQNALAGSAALGRGGQQVLVNSANGNLILQQNDDHLASTGLDLFALRTYNSQGTLDSDGNDDNWRLGFFRSVDSLTGTLNTVGSTITRTDADGARSVYRHDGVAYIGTDGIGAHDSMSYDAAARKWRWTDGESRTVETYDWNDRIGKLIRQLDANGNAVDFVYTGAQLTEVCDASGEKQLLIYDGRNLTELRTVRQDGTTFTRVRYSYDLQNRLSSVVGDLTPEDSNVADGKLYFTAYSYEGDSKRIASILESDGAQASFTYQQRGASWVVASVTHTVDGVARTTSYDFGAQGSATGAVTRITDALGNVTLVESDALGRLLKIAGPQTGGAAQSVAYTYNSAGDLLTVIDAAGNTTRYGYDSRGNQTSVLDAMGHTITRTFGSANQLLTEKSSAALPGSSYSNIYDGERLTKFVYDGANRLRFALSDDGRVTEHRYDPVGNKIAVIAYTAQTYAAAGVSEPELAAWVGAIADKSTTQRTDYGYDFRGQASTVTAWAKVAADGVGIDDGRQNVSRLVYDQSGHLLQSFNAAGLVTTTSYDGLGRVLSVTDNTGGATTVLYDDAGHRVVTRQAGGLVSTSVYSGAGQLTSVLKSDGNNLLGETRMWYDAGGLLRLTQAADGGKTLLLYDAAGCQTGVMDGAGRVTEYTYDVRGNRTGSIAYATPAAPPAFMAHSLDLTQAGNAAHLNAALASSLSSLRPAATAGDARTWNLYDAKDRLVWQIDALGYATQTVYDGLSRVLGTNRLATPVDVTQLTNSADIMLKVAGGATSLQVREAAAAAGPNGAHTFVAVLGNESSFYDATGTVSFFAGTLLLGSARLAANVASLTVANLPAGHCAITAVYSGDGNFAASSAAAIDTLVAPAQISSVTLAAGQTQVAAGVALTLTAAVSGAEPTGMVAFYSNAAVIGYAALKNGAASFTTTSLPAGAHRLTAAYLGDANNAASTSGPDDAGAAAPVAVIVTPAPAGPNATTRIGLSSESLAPVHGEAVALRADVPGVANGGMVVFFSNDGKELGHAAVAGGVASVTVRGLAAGKHAIGAMYLGDGVAGTGIGIGELGLEVAQAPTTVAVDVPAGPRPAGSPFVIVANVARAGDGFASGTVTFYNGVDIIGRADLVNGQAALTVSNLPVGMNDLSVRYGGDANNVAARSVSASQVIVDGPSSTSMTLATSKTVLTAGDKVILTANVKSRSGEPLTGIVTFFSTREVLGTAQVVNGVATLETPYFNVGFTSSYSFPTAAYSGDAANGASSATFASGINILAGVAKPAPTTSPSTLTFTATPTAVTFAEAATLRVQVGVVNSANPATGAVTFFDATGKVILGSARVMNGVATLKFTGFTAASQKIIAVYSGDQFNGASSNATGVSCTVAMKPAVINPVLTASRIGADRTGVLRLAASVSYLSAEMTALLEGSASVVFYSGTTELGIATVTNGRAVLDIAQGAVNNAQVRAVFRNDKYMLRATGSSAPVQLALGLPSPATLMVSASYPPAVIGGPLTLSAAVSFDFGGGSSTSAGSYTFYDGNIVLGTVAAGDYTTDARLQVSSVSAGEHQYRAVYTPTRPGQLVSYSEALSYSAAKVVPGMQIAHTAVDAQGAAVTWSSPFAQFSKVTVTLALPTGAAAPTGSVVLYRDGNVRLGTVQVADGKAVFLVPAGALRQDWPRFTAVYSGDLNTAAKEQATMLDNISGPNLPTEQDDKIVLSSRPDPQGRAAMVELVAGVKAANPGGTVIFKDAFGNVLGVSAVDAGTARLVLATPVGGLAGVKAIYTGGSSDITASYSAPTAQSGAASATVLTVSDSAVALSAPVTLTARVAGATAGSVEFYDGATLLGRVALQDGAAMLSTSALRAGTRQLRAIYSGDAVNAGSQSAMVAATVMGFPATVRLQTPTGPVRQGAAATYTALVEGNMPGGLVTFLSGKTVLGTAAVVRGVATMQLARNAFSPGTVDIVASYSGDEVHAGTVSASVRQSVTPGTRQLVVGSSAADRFVSSYDDGDGNVRVTIDAENFVTEYVYDAANRVIKTIAYAKAYATPFLLPGAQGTGGFTAEKIAANMPAASPGDRITYFYYDNAGRQVADVNAEGYLSEYVYDKAGRQVETIRYANVARGPVLASSTLASLRPAVSLEDQHTTSSWDLRGRLSGERAADGTVTEYTYDSDNRLTGTTRARGTEDQRTTLKRYDAQGYLKAELDGVGAALIVGQQSVAQIDAIWNAHGTSYVYDVVGKLISATAPQGQRIVYFYDVAGQLHHTVNALGEVTENTHDTLGRLTGVTRYAARVAPGAVAAMTGGTLSVSANQAAALALQQAKSAGGEQNSVTRIDYDLAGHVTATTDAMRAVHATLYNAFGEVVAETAPGTADAGALTTQHVLDHRGLETASVQRSDKVYLTTSTQYDAFGRAVRSVDANGNVFLNAFDRLGQLIQTTDPAGAVQLGTYDAFGRVLTAMDALKNVTRYSYDSTVRSNTVTTPEGVAVTTMMTRNGQIRSISDGNGNATTYRYDQNGNVLGTLDALTSTESTYDSVNRLVLSVDGGGHRIAYTYDAASRVLTRTVDPDGAKLQTRYEYDAKGQAVRVTDAAGLVTDTAFDLAGQTISQTVDAAGAARTTTYTHDAKGQIVSVVQPGGTRTDVVFDELGRRTKAITDPLGLNLVNSFEYDKNGNVIASVDAKGNRALFVYDSLDRQVYAIDPTGTVRQSIYDLQGHLIRSVVYDKRITTSKLGANPTRAAVAALVVLTAAGDAVTNLVYDKDGRVAFEVDALGGLKAYQYDGNNNVNATLAYANRIDMAAWIVGSMPAPVADVTRDVLVRTVYDALGRPVFSINALGQVLATTYGADGNVSEQIRYANPVGGGIAPTLAAVTNALVASARDQHDRYTYDHAGRVLLKADTLGNVTGYSYDVHGNVTRIVDYAKPITPGAALTSVQPSAADRATLMAYDAQDRLVLQIDVMGQLQANTYDAGGNLVQTTAYFARAPRPTSGGAPLALAAMSALVKPDAQRDRVSFSVFDADNREAYRVDADAVVTAQIFDATGNVVRRTGYATPVIMPQAPTADSMAQLVATIADPARDDVMCYVVDAVGRTLWSVNATGDAISYAYTAAGQVTSMTTYLHRIGGAIAMTADNLAGAVAGAMVSARDDYVYDAAGRLAFEIDASGTVTGHQYDGSGLEIKSTVYAARISRATFVPGTAPAVLADATRDSTLRTVYDSLGRAIFTVDREGFVRTTTYTSDCKVGEQIAYARRIDPQTAMSAQAVGAAVRQVADARLDARSAFEYDQAGRILWKSGADGKVTGYTYDADGNVTKQVEYAQAIAPGATPHSVVASAGDRTTLTAFNVHGQATVMVAADGRVSTIAYDANGKAVVHTTLANLAALPTAASMPLDATFIFPAADPLNDRTDRIVYDEAGRETFRIDQAGRVVATRYLGNTVTTIAYAHAVPAATEANASALAAATAHIADNTKDHVQRVVRDAAGRVISSIDAQGRVSKLSYDAQCNAVETTASDGAVSRKVYDGHGRVAYSIDPVGATTGYTYDASGNLVKQVQFATMLAANANPAALSLAPTADDRVTVMAYDQRGQLLYAVDPEGAVRQQQFDAAGNMTALTLFAGKVDTVMLAGAAGGAAAIGALVVPQAAADRVSRQVFDSANRLVYSVDPLGFVQKYAYDERGNMTVQTRFARSVFGAGPMAAFTVAAIEARVVADARDVVEQFDHNSLGQVIWHQDGNGKTESALYDNIGQKIGYTDKNGNAWSYRYDAAGNMVEETAPAAPGKTGDSFQRVVHVDYDALGQQLKRTESGDGEQLVQSFTYDNAGNQLSINFGRAAAYIPGSVTAQPGAEVSTSKSYDARGQVTRTVDADGYVSRNVYAVGGLLRYEIDANGNLTGYVRNSFGEVTSLVRYGGAIRVAPDGPVTTEQVAQALAALDVAKVRTITTSYDRDGRVLQVTHPAAYSIDAGSSYSPVTAARTTRMTYDAFGDAIQQAELASRLDGWDITNNYYDQRGNLAAQVDAAGYLTSYSYDSAGLVTGVRESAQAIVGWTGSRSLAAVAPSDARDRVTTKAYDGQGRVVRDTLAEGNAGPGSEHVRMTEYDGMGNVTLTAGWGPGATGSDAPHRMFYDALGRVTAAIDGSHRVGSGFGLTTYRYNLAGLPVSETSYANGSVSAGVPQPALLSPDDRTQSMQYDELGRMVRVTDAEGVSHYLGYNARGLQTASWHIGAGAAYAAGEVFGLASRTYDALGRMVTDSGQDLTLQYNAYGEVVQRTQAGTVTFWDFDNAGRMWRSNESGVNEVTVYDLLGRKSSVYRSNGSTAPTADNDVLAYVDAEAARRSGALSATTYRYDVQGNVTSITGPSRRAGVPVTTQVFDRWGNLVSKTEPGPDGIGYPTTSFTYDEKNRVTSERNAKADGSSGGRVRQFQYTDGDQDALATRVTIDRESAAVSGPADNDALHARYRVTTEQFTPTGKLLSATTNGILTERHSYDAFDQLRADEMDAQHTVHYAYDHAGHLVSATYQPVEVFVVTLAGTTLALASEGSRALMERFSYDELGFLSAHVNGAGETTRYRHDIHGNVTWSEKRGSAPTSATWDAGGRKLTAVDAFGNTAKWTYDSVGRVKTYTGFDGAVTTYAYGRDGLVASVGQPAKNQLITYTYDAAGQLTEIVDTNTGGNGYQALVRQTTYRYDLAGNRTWEMTVQGTTASDGKTFANNTLTYDALHRLIRVSASDLAEGGQLVKYEYDAFGNRTKFASVSAGKGSDRNQTGYFFYDAVNRELVSGALDAAGTTGAQTLRHSYDVAGNLAGTVSGGNNIQFRYDAMNRVISTSVNGAVAFTTSYDAAGRVLADAIKSADAPAIPKGMAMPSAPAEPLAPTPPPTGSSQQVLDQYAAQKAQYDKDMLAYGSALTLYRGQLKDYQDQHAFLQRLGLSFEGNIYERHLKSYDGQGRLVIDQGLKDNGAVKSMVVNEAFDAAGNVLSYRTESMVEEHIRNSYTNTYRTLGSGVVLASSTGRMTILSGKMAGESGSEATSTDVYDANGFLIGVTYSTVGDAPQTGTSNKAFILDQNGVILLAREQSHNSPTAEQHEIVANGQLQLRYSTTYGSFDDLEDTQKDAFWKAYNASATQSMVSANGELRVNAGATSATGQTVIVAAGDTLQSIAARIYGSPDAWHRIADANNLQSGSALVPGAILVAPAATASSSAPNFDLGKLVGSTAPNLPPPPPDNQNCVAMLLIVVVVVVTVLVTPYMTQAAGYLLGAGTETAAVTVTAGAMTSAAANVASQAVGVALGVQDDISWSAVGMAALGGAINKGVNVGWINVSPDAWVNSAVANVMTQKIGVMTGMQEKFSWAAVAGAGVSAQMQQGMAQGFFGKGLQTTVGDGFREQFIRGGLSGFAGSLTTELMTPGKQDWAKVALGAFEGALSGALNVERHDVVLGQTSNEASDAEQALPQEQEEAQAQAQPAVAETAAALTGGAAEGPTQQKPVEYKDAGIGYVDKVLPPEVPLNGWSKVERLVQINHLKWTAAEKAKYDRQQACQVNPFNIMAELGKYALGGMEMAVNAVRNESWRLLGAVIALPALADSTEAYIAVSQQVADRFHVDNRSQGARAIGEAIQPYAAKAMAALDAARDYSEKRIGLGATTLLFATADAGFQIATLVGPGKLFGIAGRGEGIAAEVVRSRLVTLTEVVNPTEQAAMRTVAVERGLTAAATGEVAVANATRAVQEAVQADAAAAAGGRRAGIPAAGGTNASANAAGASGNAPGLTSSGGLVATDSAAARAGKALNDVQATSRGGAAHAANNVADAPSALTLDRPDAIRIHPARDAAQSKTVLSKESILRGLRQAGTPESFIAAKLISKGKLQVVIRDQMETWTINPKTGMKEYAYDPFTRGSYNPYRPYEINIYTKNLFSMRQAAGVIVHEVTHFRQYDRAAFSPDFQFHMGHEFEANRAQGLVDPEALGAPLRNLGGTKEGLSDWALWYRLESNKGYNHVSRDPVKRGEFSLRNDWKQLFLVPYYRALGG